MYNNSYMNFLAPAWNYYDPRQVLMPRKYPLYRNFRPFYNSYAPLLIFQNYFRRLQPFYVTPQINLPPSTWRNQEQKDLVFGVPYNREKGELLAKNIVDILPQQQDTPLCARYVKLAVEKSGLGPYIHGPNGEGCKNVFRANPNFREVKVKGKDFENLPKGSIIVYDSGTKVKDKSGNETQIGDDGHVLITLGNGKGCSDVMEDEILQTDNAYTFIPV